MFFRLALDECIHTLFDECNTVIKRIVGRECKVKCDKISLPCTDRHLNLRGKYLLKNATTITFYRTPIQLFSLIILAALNILYEHTTDLFHAV